MSDISVDSTARDQAAAVRAREISARELLDLHLARIAERNGEVNADRLAGRRAGRAALQQPPTSRWPPVTAVGPLHGLPFAVKDTHAVAGWRTTFGSPLHADFVPDADTLAVERIRGAGVVLLGRTNVPEFAAGSHTFNTDLRDHAQPGATRAGPRVGRAGERRRPSPRAWCRWPTARTWVARCATRRRSAGWSACGPRWAASPTGRRSTSWETTSVAGPMARNVGDAGAAALGDGRAGPTRAAGPRRSRSRRSPRRASADLQGLRVAWSVDLGGAFEVDHEVARCIESPGTVFTSQGAQLSRGVPRPGRGRGHLPHAARVALPGRSTGRRWPRTRTRSSSPSPTTSVRGSR